MVYLIHFQKSYYHSQHYIGYSENGHTLKKRIEHHQNGNGAKLLRAVSKAGIPFEIVRVWKDGDRNFERKLKNQKNAKRFCPICNPVKCYERLNGLK